MIFSEENLKQKGNSVVKAVKLFLKMVFGDYKTLQQ
jgi:hypothetical protein